MSDDPEHTKDPKGEPERPPAGPPARTGSVGDRDTASEDKRPPDPGRVELRSRPDDGEDV